MTIKKENKKRCYEFVKRRIEKGHNKTRALNEASLALGISYVTAQRWTKDMEDELGRLQKKHVSRRADRIHKDEENIIDDGKGGGKAGGNDDEAKDPCT